MKRKDSDKLVEEAESSDMAERPHSAQHVSGDAKDTLPRSPTPTMKTDSVDTDSQSISASQSPVHSSSSPTTHSSSSPQEPNSALNQLQVALKLLVSNSASGLIIGRSGSTISDLQAKSLTRIKLSQGGDYYPGTSDRVCLIQGSLSNASSAMEMVLTKLYELQSFQQVSSVPATQNQSEATPVEKPSTSFIVRLLVPSTCCGMIIGRGGTNIKTLKEKSEVTYIQLSPKEHEIMIGGSTLSTSERIMTITGPNFKSCVNCVRIILNDMAQNPEISRYINMTTSYSKNIMAAGPSAYTVTTTRGFFLEHEQFQHQGIGQPQILESPPRYSVPEPFMPGQFSSSPSQLQPEQNISLLPQQLMQHQATPANYEPIGQGDMSLPLLGDPSTMIQSQPYGQGMMQSPSTIPDSGPTSSSYPQYQPPQSGQTMQFWSPDASSGSPGRAILPSGSGNISVDQLSQSFQAQASLQSHPSHSSLQHLASSPLVTAQLGVPDVRIGSILGRGGKTLTEIQALSQTKIRISQRGEFIPGTQNRVVTITGNTAQDVEHAQHLVNQRLSAGYSRSSSSSELRQMKDG